MLQWVSGRAINVRGEIKMKEGSQIIKLYKMTMGYLRLTV